MKDGTFIEMSSRTMALKPLFLRTLLFTSSVAFTAATSFNLSSEITRFVPSCARQCLRSHLSANYAPTVCGSLPSLQCLCANAGASGLTIGEGAVQCLVAEKTIGSCRENDAPQSVIDTAYLMCLDQPNAIIPTHTAIIATLILPSSGAGIIVLPPPTTSPVVSPTSTRHSTTTRTTTPFPSTLVTATGTPSIPSSFSTLTRSNTSQASATRSFSTPPPPTQTPTQTSTASPSSSPTAAPGAEEANSNPSERFGTAQVAGLAVGLAAAIGIAVLAICLARRRRRKNYPDAKTGFFPVREKDSWEFHPQEGPANIFHISPPLHHTRSPSPPLQRPPDARTRTSARASWWPGAIGLAVSRPLSSRSPLQPPPQKQQQQQQNRPASRLLPAKPVLSSPRPLLSIKIPQADLASSSTPQAQTKGNSEQTNSQILNEKTAKLTAPPRAHYNLGRESTMTEFEEDGVMTSARSQRSNTVWRPPSGKTPQSATIAYVADKNGNWVLVDPKSATHMAQLAGLDVSGTGEAKKNPSYAESAMLAAAASKVGIGHGAGSPIAPTAPRMPPAPLLLPPAEIVPAKLSAPQQSRSSSIYSQNTTRPNTAVPPGNPQQYGGPPHPVPSMSFSHPEPPRRRSDSIGRRSSSKSKPALTAPTPSSGAGNPPHRSDSHDSQVSQASVTTIASSIASDSPEPAPEQSSLSPVVESPASNASLTGHSPVSYPLIPGRTSSKPTNNNLRLLAPPTRTYAALPPGQPSPTLGVMIQQQQASRNGPYMASYDVPRKPVARPRPADPNRVATGSPSLRLVTPSPPSDTEPHEQATRPPQMRPLYPAPLQAHRPRLERGNPHPQAQAAQIQQVPPALEPQSATVYKALWGDAPARQQTHPLPQQQQQQQPKPQPPPRNSRRLSQQQYQQQRQSFQPQPVPTQQSPPPKQPLPSRPPSHVAAQTALAPPVRPTSDAPPLTTSSTTSSLLSKRLGTERAAALAPLHPNAAGGVRHSPNWRPYRPGAGGDVLFSPDAFFPAPPVPESHPRKGGGGGDLPATPTWQPRLTPTRRGDDLFLNVQ